jgi:phosphoserine phosphatase RsbU/P
MKENIEKANRLLLEKQSKLDLQLQLAQVIQKTLLPPVTYSDNQITISTSFLQASEIGGDFYLVVPINDDKVTFCIGDVMGKGVPAAMVMTILIGIFSDLIKSNLSIAQIMNEANRKLIEYLEEVCYATVFLASYEKSKHLLTYVCAGHDKPYIINQHDFEEVKLEKSDVIIGVFENIRYNKHEYVMNKGDRLVLYTDGLIDAYNKNKEHFGQERLYDTISKFKHVPLRKFNEEIIKEIQHFIKGTPQHDDMALVVLEVK